MLNCLSCIFVKLPDIPGKNTVEFSYFVKIFVFFKYVQVVLGLEPLRFNFCEVSGILYISATN